ncbi:hypothetical protein HW555_009012 [Spodoptera exigua]|uniref:Aspartyl/asparaginy/proline hydroxylase domain-containing protein n=1 Tax=Spodoptera exigua TaxID=7107 RepID=A0A835L164_SPOEX|nr:hypothetical protein HW555_009012 [Spodoptera exigua]
MLTKISFWTFLRVVLARPNVAIALFHFTKMYTQPFKKNNDSFVSSHLSLSPSSAVFADELSVDEGPRGTAAALGEGDVFMHSPNDHGTGGHWCAKIIFFSLLAVLVTLIGLIILENRGLSELEANSVESRYSGVLEGWLEDAPDDDHHDEHTLELKHHDEDNVKGQYEEKPSKEVASEDDGGADADDVAEDEEFLEPADIEEELPVVEHIVAPKGKPLVELAVGGALLVATHAVVRRATAPRDDTPASDEHGSREETPVIDRRMTLIAEEAAAAAVPSEVVEEIEVPVEKIIEKVSTEEVEKESTKDKEFRLEAKYGRLPEPERPGQKHKDGGNSIEDDWPGEPSDQYWRQQLDQAEEELRQMNERLTDLKLLEVAHRTLDRIRFRGNYLSAEPVYRLLIRRFPDVPGYYNNLTISFLMANRADLAEQVIKDTLKKWPDDRVALAHYGFVLKTQHNRLEEAVDAFQKALQNDTGPATESRFYYHLGDSLLLLGRYAEAHEVHKRGAAMGHFLSPSQRSLYNVNRLKSRPWWNIEQTPYTKLARALEKSWKEILKEGEAAKALYEKEKEDLKERGEWSQLDLFVRGQEIPNRCKRAPVTCSIVRSEVAASGCRRGQIKFSAMEAGTHVRPHVGPTNCRLRMHLGLSNTKDTYIRVDQETRQWKVGKTFMFDDSFEHEVWHNGTGTRLVLIVDVWHPDLTPAERRSLPPI